MLHLGKRPLNHTKKRVSRGDKSEKAPLKAPPAQNDRKGSRAFKGTSRFPRPPTLRAIVASSLATDVGALLFRLYWPLELPSLPRGNFEGPKPRSGLIRTFGFRRRNRTPMPARRRFRGIVQINFSLICTRVVYTKPRDAIHITFIGITRNVFERCKKKPAEAGCR